MKYKEQKNTATGETRWVPVSGEEKTGKKTWSQKVIDLPIIGDIAGTLIPSATGIGTAISNPLANKQIDTQYGASRDIIKQAIGEQDPTRKAELLQQSRDIDTGISEKASKYQESVESGMGYFNDPNKETNTLIQKLSAYGPQATRTGVAAGTLLASGISGVAKPATSMLGRLASRAITGGVIGALTGASEKDEASVAERLIDASESGTVGLAIGTIFGLGEESVRLIKSGGLKKLADKLNLPRQWGKELEKTAKAYKGKVNTNKTKEMMKKWINAEQSVANRPKLLKMVDEEDFGSWNLWKTVTRKRGAGFRPQSPAIKNIYNEYLRRSLRETIHTLSPAIQQLDKNLSRYYAISEPVKGLISSKLARILGVYKIFDVLMH